MADLSQFLSNGGKRYRVASKDKVVLANLATLVVTPAFNEFVVYFSESTRSLDISTARTTLTSVGFNQIGVPISFGLGEEVTFTGAATSGSTDGTYFIYEEDV